MDIETDGLEAGTGGEAIVPVVDAVDAANSEATAEQQKPHADEEGSADDAGDKPKRKPWFQERIDDVTRQKYEAQREADYWRGMAEGRAQSQQPPVEHRQDGPPREEDFGGDYDAFQSALIDYRVDQRLNQERALAQRNSVVQTYQQRVQEARSRMADYDQVVGDPSLPITDLMAEVIRESELGPEVAYHLGTNRSEAQRIAGLPPHRQAAELGKLEARLSAPPAPPPAPRNPPPPPPKTVSGLASGLNEKNPEEMSIAEYRKWRGL